MERTRGSFLSVPSRVSTTSPRSHSRARSSSTRACACAVEGSTSIASAVASVASTPPPPPPPPPSDGRSMPWVRMSVWVKRKVKASLCASKSSFSRVPTRVDTSFTSSRMAPPLEEWPEGGKYRLLTNHSTRAP
eukprot:1188268-Prorocentrum_minimum.AAC.2